MSRAGKQDTALQINSEMGQGAMGLGISRVYYKINRKIKKIQMISKNCQNFLNKSLPFCQRLKSTELNYAYVSHVFYLTK